LPGRADPHSLVDSHPACQGDFLQAMPTKPPTAGRHSSRDSRLKRAGRSVWTAAVAFLFATLWSVVFGVPVAELSGWEAAGALIVCGTAFGTIYLVPWRGRRARRRRALMRLRAPGRHVWSTIPLLGLAYLVLGLAIAMLGMMGGWMDEAVARHTRELPSGPAMLIFGLVLAPLIEELFYRGSLQRSLERAAGPIPAILLTAAVFALAHDELVRFPNLWAGGIVLGVTAYTTRSVWPGVLMHMINNSGAYAIGMLLPLQSVAEVRAWLNAHGGVPMLVLVLLASAATGAGLLLRLRERTAQGGPGVGVHEPAGSGRLASDPAD
jgi:membrane protease YdiL (CAAX protease family)